MLRNLLKHAVYNLVLPINGGHYSRTAIIKNGAFNQVIVMVCACLLHNIKHLLDTHEHVNVVVVVKHSSCTEH